MAAQPRRRRLREERHRLDLHALLPALPGILRGPDALRGGATGFDRWDDGVKGIITFILVTVASDTGGYVAGVLFGKHPMAPVISPKKSWEGFAGSLIACVAAGWALVVYMLDGDWWVGVVLGLIAVVMATLGDLVESVMKRDLGIKDMSQIIPGHGGLMDRLDSLLATIAPIWLLLHYLVF
ncbi:phosphatidate cytidylyltransferase [Nocardioides alcanivorans]|uniref:phosphatidate cytidylyltransferase n=1 Tax=Nocardioides alcanivorans TaxID=2897352 RepID=UPI00289CFAA2|nr:phosphatidate cytidylyltransferase [Nocardioides alcanivorans]